jgi:type II secretory pathway component PulJ
VSPTPDIDRAGPAAHAVVVHLTDLLVSLAVLGVIAAVTLTAIDAGQRGYAIGAARVESQQSARQALERLTRDIRNAGLDGRGIDFPAVAVAEADRLVLQTDLDGDGVIAARGETIVWLVRDGVLRRDAGGGAQPITDGVRRLALQYLDTAGVVTAIPGAVRTVVIALATEAVYARSPAGEAGAVYRTQVRLRNR